TIFDNVNAHVADLDLNLAGVSDLNLATSGLRFPSASFMTFGSCPVAWAHDDPADSLYRSARDALNRGDYRHAADMFKSLPQKYPSSAYVADAQYWEAFSLYRIGGTPELREALAVLEARKVDSTSTGRRHAMTVRTPRASINGSVNYAVDVTAYSDAFGRSTQTDAAGLAARIANVLSSRGLAADPAVKRALAAGGDICDQEDQAVRAEALSALMQNDPETGRQMAAKILANRDECSVPLRRNAVMVLASRRDDAATAALVPVAKSDPSAAVRSAAISYLVRAQTDAATQAVIDIATSDTSSRIRRLAVEALGQSGNARARAAVRSIIQSSSDAELQMAAIDGLDRDQLTADDAVWLRGLYTKASSTAIKARIVAAVARAGGDANTQWLLALVRNPDEPLESRTMALDRAGRNMDAATLARIYDASSERPIRRTTIMLLAEHSDSAAVDKLIEIAKNGTDPDMRRQAIDALARSKDPRASKLLLQLVDR
ncbi:MAG: HEAT repeat domain-containing protein, partial [Gemmatimonadales bacterium]